MVCRHRTATKKEDEQKRILNALRVERAKDLSRETTLFRVKVGDQRLSRGGVDSTEFEPAPTSAATSILESKQSMCQMVATDPAFADPARFEKPVGCGVRQWMGFRHNVARNGTFAVGRHEPQSKQTPTD